MPMPFKRVLRHRHASAIGGWLPMPRSGYASPSERLYSRLSNFQSLVWVVDAGGRGQPGVVATGRAGCGLDGPIGATSRGWPPAEGTPCPSPRPHLVVGDSPNFSPLFRPLK